MKTQAEKVCGRQLPKQANPEHILQRYFALRPEQQLNFVRAGSSIPAKHRLRSDSQHSSQG